LIVVDASVLIDFLLGRKATVDQVLADLRAHNDELLHAPDLIEPEALQALRGLERGGLLSEQRAIQALSRLASARLVRHPHAPLRDRVWELRHNLSAYDATYLALAEALREPVLLTGDKGLAEAAAATLGPDRVHRI
jgi:predicted nucleic acid-binding protein